MSNIDLKEIGKRARLASLRLSSLADERIVNALKAVAFRIEKDTEDILEANSKDMNRGRENGMSQGLLDRLLLTKERIQSIAHAILDIASMPSPVGETLSEDIRPNGLNIQKIRVPIGVIGIIYEARPNVTSDAFSLCFRTGNAVILKGGSDAIESNIAITRTIREALKEEGITEDAIQLIEDTRRETTLEFMRLSQYVNVLIPRGSHRLIQSVMENASIPVLETGAGNCHIYIDETADREKAISILFNAKTQRIGVCNACESLLLHRSALPMLPYLLEKLEEKDVLAHVDSEGMQYLESIEYGASLAERASLRKDLIVPATDADYYTEYLDYEISVKVVEDVNEAIIHINEHSTKHSETIITESTENAEVFLRNVDSACVYHNASTRFTDGGEFGFGAEIGISTSKLHARGPMGLRELTSSKYLIRGNGQIR